MQPTACRRWLSAIVSVASTVCGARESFPVRELTVHGVYATKGSDSAVYCLLGRGEALESTKGYVLSPMAPNPLVDTRPAAG